MFCNNMYIILSSVKGIKFKSDHPPSWDNFSHQTDSNFLNKPLLFYLKIKPDYFDLWSNKTKTSVCIYFQTNSICMEIRGRDLVNL